MAAAGAGAEITVRDHIRINENFMPPAEFLCAVFTAARVPFVLDRSVGASERSSPWS